MSLPADNHVHSQWSWDTTRGDMEATCEQAVRLGLPSVAFTEHVDQTERSGELDVEGYLECVERCRGLFPSLRILTGVELGEPHWFRAEADAMLARAPFERVLASLHSQPHGGHDDVNLRFREEAAEEVMRDYLDEAERLITAYPDFQVLAHIDYPVRRWPAGPERFDPTVFEEHYRHVLGRLRDAGKVLEVNTRVPLHPLILRWWHDEGGEAISFASDAHRPELVAHGFADAVALAEATGFRAGRDPLDFWGRA